MVIVFFSLNCYNASDLLGLCFCMSFLRKNTVKVEKII
ncbi:hypothetical protein CKA32_003289 [Geitlerinema sp. FC II]|nr:hypothetical protein CKA32_003289 [Geitlerinema sp. FC II]